MATAEADNGREYFRIAGNLRVRARPLREGRRAELESRILTRERKKSELDPALVERLERLESRLDLLLEHFGLGDGPTFRDEDLQHVLFSGSGIRMKDPGDAVIGQEWVLDVEIPETPPRRIQSLACVKQVGLGGDGLPGDVAFKFMVIHESDRDAIVAHSLAIERRSRAAGLDGAR